MGWTRYLDYKGLRFAVQSGAFMSDIPGEIVAVFIRDEKTIQAIRSNDERVLNMLNYMIDEIDELSLSAWAADPFAYEHWRKEKDIDEYEQSLYTILSGKYTDDETKERARAEIDWVTQERQRYTEKSVKKFHSQRRRLQFARNYDQLMLALIQRDGYKCTICGTIEDLTVDHLIPLSKGGSDDISNLRLLCRTHNSMKGDR